MVKRIWLCDDAITQERFHGQSSDEDNNLEIDGDDGEKDSVEDKIHNSDTEAVQEPKELDKEILDLYEDHGDEFPLAYVHLVRDKDKNVIEWRKNPPLPINVRTSAENCKAPRAKRRS